MKQSINHARSGTKRDNCWSASDGAHTPWAACTDNRNSSIHRQSIPSIVDRTIYRLSRPCPTTYTVRSRIVLKLLISEGSEKQRDCLRSLASLIQLLFSNNTSAYLIDVLKVMGQKPSICHLLQI